MDTSETYIKMCDCEEIQSHSGGDGAYYEPHNFVADEEGNIAKEDDGYFYMLFGKKCIWLPRQDQLQEMVSIGRGNIVTGLLALNNFIDRNARYEMLDWSMEQLWLAFYMSEKHSKTWSGEDWIND